MEINRGYKVELDPNNSQCTLLLQHAGAARWVYNWGLARKISVYKETQKSPNAIALHKEIVVLKHTLSEDGGFPWLNDLSKCAPQEALRDLDNAFKKFFTHCKKGKGKKGFPKFKSRHRSQRKFRLTGTIKVVNDGRYIQLPVLGRIKLKERSYLPQTRKNSEVKILSASLSERAGRWFVSLAVKEVIPNTPKRPRAKVVIGVDVGVKSLAVASDGTVYKNPKALYKATRRLRHLQRALSRKQKGSNNRQKARLKLSLAFYRVSCVRQDVIHKATTDLIRKADVVCIESLNVAGMMRNHCLARSVSDASLAEFLRQIKYKAEWAGVEVIEAPRFYPSSKTCSGCGHVRRHLALSERVYVCEKCGLEIDRDLNASLNLRNLAGSSPVSACGEDVSLVSQLAGSQAASVKQESNSSLGSLNNSVLRIT